MEISAIFLAWNRDLCRAVFGVYARALLAYQRRRAWQRGIRGGQSGCVTVIQRFGGGLNLNVHFRTLVLDGDFTEREGDTLRFQPAPPPTDEEIGAVLTTIARRVRCLLRRRGLDAEADVTPPDLLAEESPALAGIGSASIPGARRSGAPRGRPRVASGRRAGRPLGVLERPSACTSRGLRSPRKCRGARRGPRATRAALPLSVAPGGQPGPAPAPERRPPLRSRLSRPIHPKIDYAGRALERNLSPIGGPEREPYLLRRSVEEGDAIQTALRLSLPLPPRGVTAGQ